MKGKPSPILKWTDHREIMELSKLTSRPITTSQQVSNILSGRSTHFELMEKINQKIIERQQLQQRAQS